MLKNHLRRKNGSTTLLNTLIGAVIGLMIVVFLILLVRPLFGGINDRQQKEFDELKDKLNEIGHPGTSTYTSENILFDLQPGYAVIGFGATETIPNGRFGNGEFFYMFSKADRQDRNTEAFTRELMYLDRGDVKGCASDDSCLCLCKEPSSEKVDAAEAKERFIDKDKQPNPYLKPWVSDDQRKDFMHESAPERYRKLVCKEISCTPLQPMIFHTPMPCTCYFSKEGSTECDYSFENGFAIYNREKDYSSSKGVAYEKTLPPSVQVTIGKLPNGAVAVALNSTCIQQLEDDVTR